MAKSEPAASDANPLVWSVQTGRAFGNPLSSKRIEYCPVMLSRARVTLLMELRLKHSIAALLAVWFSFALSSCGDRYELAQDKEGRTIRLDKSTGEVAVLMGDRLVIAKTPQQVESEETAAREQAKALGSPKDWPYQTFKPIGVTNAKLTTVWKDGSLRYQLYLLPVPKNFDKTKGFSAPLSLKLYDDSGFEVINVDLYKATLTGVVDEKGDRVGLSANAATPCSKADYENLATWSLTWRM